MKFYMNFVEVSLTSKKPRRINQKLTWPVLIVKDLNALDPDIELAMKGT